MRLLVAYASMAGSTEGVAEAIADTLRSEGDEAVLADANDVTSVEGYDGVILGSGIYEGRWLADARDFLDAYADGLREVPVAYFAVYLKAEDDEPEEVAEDAYRYAHWPRHDWPHVHPVAAASFRGALDPQQLTGGQNIIATALGEAPGDFRDFDAIQRWAREARAAIASAMAGSSA
jgi:menaquinone-dependent protoporphyrinogen oxidase